MRNHFLTPNSTSASEFDPILLVTSLATQTLENRTGTNRDSKVDVGRLPNLYDQADLEPSRLHGVEHYHTEERHHL